MPFTCNTGSSVGPEAASQRLNERQTKEAVTGARKMQDQLLRDEAAKTKSFEASEARGRAIDSGISKRIDQAVSDSAKLRNSRTGT